MPSTAMSPTSKAQQAFALLITGTVLAAGLVLGAPDAHALAPQAASAPTALTLAPAQPAAAAGLDEIKVSTAAVASEAAVPSPETAEAAAIQPAEAAEEDAEEPAGDEDNLALMLLFAFLGGLILNIMPCVLPVLSIKALGLVQQAGEGRRAIFWHGMAYTLGVLLSFAVLAGLVIGLQQSGKLVGWGFQLQSPMFVAILGALTFGFGLSLFGVYEVTLPGASSLDHAAAKRHGYSGSVLSGVFATLLATPCTAPLLAPALGFAMAQPPATLFGFLQLIGLGLATPFLLLGIFPGWSRFLPKPGAWMETFKKLMGFLLAGTTVWMIDILSAQVSADSVTNYLIFLTALSFAAFVYGNWGGFMREQRTRTLALVAALAILGGSSVMFLEFEPRARASQPKIAAEGEIQWQDFANTDVEALASKGQTVFVDFTADWCVTCKAYEKTVIETDEIRQVFADNCVTTVKADYTLEDPNITKWLKRYKRPGVPMYLIIPANQPAGAIALPDVLTKSAIVDGLRKAGPTDAGACST